MVPKVIHRLLADLTLRPAYVLNLRWDVLAWNATGEQLFQFAGKPPEQRNLLWMLFTADRHLRQVEGMSCGR